MTVTPEEIKNLATEDAEDTEENPKPEKGYEREMLVERKMNR
jgi:hypothetical protein